MEWVKAFTPDQVARATSMLPRSLGMRFGWDDPGHCLQIVKERFSTTPKPRTFSSPTGRRACAIQIAGVRPVAARGARRSLELILPHDHFVADIHPAVEIDYVVVDQPETA